MARATRPVKSALWSVHEVAELIFLESKFTLESTVGILAETVELDR